MPILTTAATIFTTAHILDAIVSGVVGNRADKFIQKSGTIIRDRLLATANKPENHDVQRAVRKAYLSATLLACNHLKKNKPAGWLAYFFKQTTTIREVGQFLKKEIRVVEKTDWMPRTDFDTKSEILFNQENASSDDHIYKLKADLIERIVGELDRQKLFTDNAFKEALQHGWTEHNKSYDWLDLITVFFHEEIKTNTRLTNFIQTQYLDDLKGKVSGLSLKWPEVNTALEKLEYNYKQIHNQLVFVQNDLRQIVDLILENQSISKEGNSKVTDNNTLLINLTSKLDGIEQGSKKHHTIPKSIYTSPILPEPFIGREEELENIRQHLFEDPNKFILISGNGGMGKSTLASKYYHTHYQEYAHLAWITSENDLDNALLSLTIDLGVVLDKKHDTAQRIKNIYDKLRKLGEPCLLVIDNANELDQLTAHYKALKSLGGQWHVLMTTRLPSFREEEIIKLEGLEEEKTLTLFKVLYPRLQEEEKELVLQIRHSVNANTLVMELLAKNLKQVNEVEDSYSIQDLLKDIQDKGLLKLRETSPVDTVYQKFVSAKPEAIISAMYDIRALQDGEKTLISNMAVLPSQPIPFQQLKVLLGEHQALKENLKALSVKGWLEFDKGGRSYKTSPVIQEVVRDKNAQRLERDCTKLLSSLIDQLEPDEIHKDNYAPARQMAGFAEVALKNLTALSYKKSILLHHLGNLFGTLGDLRKSHSYFERYSQANKALLLENPDSVGFKNGLAISYEKLGTTHSAMGNLPKALEYFEKQTKLFEQLYEAYKDNVDFKNGLAISYSKLGTTHSAMGNLPKALEYFEKQTKLFEQLYEAYKDNVDFKNGLAISYSKLGTTHSAMGNLPKALEYFEKRSALGKQLYEAYKDNVDFKNGLAISYSKLGTTHSAMGNLPKALEYFENDLQLTKQLYEAYKDNVDFKNGLAISYEKLGTTHSAMGNLPKALEYFEKRSALGKQLYEAYKDNVDFKNGLAISYEKLGTTHSAMGNLPKALEYFEKQTKLFEQLYEAYKDNVDFKNGLAISYSKLGTTHSAMGNLPKALEYFENDLQLTKQLYEAYKDNVDFKNGLAISYEKLGTTHSAMGNLPKALEYFEKQTKLFEQLYEAYKDNVDFKNGLAISYFKLGAFSKEHLKDKKKACGYFKQAHVLWEELVKLAPAYAQFQQYLKIVNEMMNDLGC